MKQLKAYSVEIPGHEELEPILKPYDGLVDDVNCPYCTDHPVCHFKLSMGFVCFGCRKCGLNGPKMKEAVGVGNEVKAAFIDLFNIQHSPEHKLAWSWKE